MKKSKISLDLLPQLITFFDNCEFDNYKEVFNTLGLNLTIEEIDCDDDNMFYAVVYKKDYRPSKYIDQLIVDLKKDSLDKDDDLSCPGCGCKSGEGLTATCNHMEGCGYFRAFSNDSD